MTPSTDLSFPINSPLNATFVCNVSEDQVARQAIWEVEGRQIQPGQSGIRTVFENLGIIIEDEPMGGSVASVIVTSEARQVYQMPGVMVRCTAVTQNPPVIQLGPILFVRTYGKFMFKEMGQMSFAEFYVF